MKHVASEIIFQPLYWIVYITFCWNGVHLCIQSIHEGIKHTQKMQLQINNTHCHHLYNRHHCLNPVHVYIQISEAMQCRLRISAMSLRYQGLANNINTHWMPPWTNAIFILS